MTSTSERGHAKNLANFKAIIHFAEGIKDKYNPSSASIKLDALNALAKQVEVSLTALKISETDLGLKVSDRSELFEGFQKLSTRILSTFKASSDNKGIIGEAVTLNRRIQGKRAGEIQPATAGSTANNISVSRLSYDNITDNFESLIKVLRSEPQYSPNEDELKVATLEKLHESFKKANDDVSIAETARSVAARERNALMYKPEAGLIDIAQKIKLYLKGLYGADSPEFAEVSGIELGQVI